MIILGIDPGLSGALALYDTSEQTVEVFDMPVLELVRNGKKKGEVSAQALANHLAGRKVNSAFLERVNAMTGQGVTSVFSFGRSTGIVEGVLAAYDIPTTLVTPQAWQKAVGQRAVEQVGNDIAGTENYQAAG